MAINRLPRIVAPASIAASERTVVPTAPDPSVPPQPAEPAATGTLPSVLRSAPSPDGIVGDLITPAGAATRLGVTIKVLERWRASGAGPAFVMLTSKTIRYRPADVDAFITDRILAPELPSANRFGPMRQPIGL